MCNCVATSFCKGCRRIWYCSKFCQKDDWPIHKLLCKTFTEFYHKNRPGPNHYRAIYFPVDETKPRFVWIDMGPQDILLDGEKHRALGISEADLAKLQDDRLLEFIRGKEQNDVLKRQHQRICHMGGLGPKNCSFVHVGKHNKSLAKINAKLPEAMKGPHLYHGWLADLDLLDFRHIVDWVRTEFDNYKRQWHQHRTGIGGVRINCHGDIHISERPELEPWPFEDSHFVPRPTQLSIPIAEKLGFPLIMHSLWPGLAWRDRRLVVNNDPDTEITEERSHSLEAMNPALWRAMPSTLVVARKDRKPQRVAHVHVLKLYCVELGHRWGGVFPTGDDGDDPLRNIVPGLDSLFRAKADFMLEKANREDFLVVWNEYMGDSGREKYGGVASPYDV
jgi:hypothetical protein